MARLEVISSDKSIYQPHSFLSPEESDAPVIWFLLQPFTMHVDIVKQYLARVLYPIKSELKKKAMGFKKGGL